MRRAPLALSLAASCVLAGADAAAADVAAMDAPASDPEKAVAPSSPSAPAPARPHDLNVVSFEPLGNGLLYSVNYERVVRAWDVGLRAGASFFTYKVSNASGSGNLVLATFPMVVSYYVPLAGDQHKLQLGLGATVLYFSASSDSTGTKFEGDGVGLGVAGTAVVGYRFVPRAGGVSFGVGFTPLVRAKKGFLPWGGVQVGYAFE